MLALYAGALLAGLAAVAIQLFAGHDADHGGLDHGADHDGNGDGDAGDVWSVLASVRFWAFGLLAFGLVGTLTAVFHLAGPALTAAVSTAAGIASGVFAVTAIRRLTRRTASSHATRGDLVGKLGKVVVPVGAEWRGKVRIEVKGALIDVPARATEAIGVGEVVLVEEDEGDAVRVERAPSELSRLE